MNVTFRRLGDDDLPRLHRWLNDPDVIRWWEGNDVSWEGVVSDYGSASTEIGEHWISVVDEQDIGWIQCYAVADSPMESEPWWALGVDEAAAGIDYLIGAAANRGRGIGTAMVRAFVDRIVFPLHPDWSQACAAPAVENVASWRILEKAGFRFVGLVEDESGKDHLMAVDRPGKRLADDLSASVG